MTNIKDSIAKEQQEIAQRLQAVIDTAIDGIITIDTKGIIESINLSGAKHFGYETSELIGNNISLLMPEPHKTAHDNYIERYLTSRKPKIIGIGREVMGLRKDGSTFPIRLAVSEVVLNDRTIFTGIIHDLSEVKSVHEKLESLNEELEGRIVERTNELENVVNKLLESNQKLHNREIQLKHSLDKEKELNELKSRFVSMASHEFRTPLSTILSSVSLIGRYNEEEDHFKRTRHVERIKSAVTNLNGILNDLLSLGKIEDGKESVEISLVDVSEICSEVKDEVEGLLEPDQEIHLVSTASSKMVETDPRILKNIIFNLLSNAIKYSRKKSEILCEISELPDKLKIKIVDNGIGIPQNDQNHLFDRFYRASNVENIQGTGLGLHIVGRYLDLLSGHISFESTEGIGSTFVVLLPLQLKGDG